MFRLISPVVVGCLGAFRISTCTAVANEVHEDDMPWPIKHSLMKRAPRRQGLQKDWAERCR